MVPSISQGRLPFSRETNLPEKPHLLPTARFFPLPGKTIVKEHAFSLLGS
jgi:hypothetical protein